MRKKCHIIMAALLISVLAFAGCSSKLSVWNGYIIDKHCFEAKYSETGTSEGKENKMNCNMMTKDPSKETKECLTMKSCAESGYGIIIKQEENKYNFYKFDDNGQKLVKDILSKTSKETDFSISVKGTLKGDTIKVASISEK